MLNVYPVPFSKSIFINFISDADSKTVVSILDIFGKELSKSILPVLKGVNKIQFTTTRNIEAGEYILTLNLGNNRFITKVIKAVN